MAIKSIIMNLKELHESSKTVSAKPLFHCTDENALSLQILKGEELKEHITKKPALLLCIEGSAMFSSINGVEIQIGPGEMVNIAANLKHKVQGLEDSQLILLR